MPDRGQRTEKPTPRRVQKARQQGRFVVSRDLVAGLQFLAFVILLALAGGTWLIQLANNTRYLLAAAFRREPGANGILSLVGLALYRDVLPLALGGAVLLGVTLMAQLGVTRFGLAVKRLAPDAARLNIVSRLRELPRQNWAVFRQAVLLLPLFALAVYAVVKSNLDTLLRLPLEGVAQGARQVAVSIQDLLWKAAVVFVALGVVDYWRQHRRYMRDLAMTKQEVREEAKETEGNPQTRARIRRLQRELLRRQMMRQVPKATAVVVNPTHYAVALRYQTEVMPAPRVVAKGKNYLAQRIRKLAIHHQVPVIENPPLAQALYESTEVGQEIPPHLYRAVAEVLAYIYRLMGGRLP
jgi:flagellar biosynthetic protein FlhB